MSDGLPALALAFAPMREHLMKQPPQRELKLFDFHAKRFIVLMGSFIAVTILILYFTLLPTWGLKIARTSAFIQMDIAQVFMFVGLWSAYRSIKSVGKFITPVFLIGFLVPIFVQFIINEIPQAASALHIVTVPIGVFIMLIALSVIPTVLYALVTRTIDHLRRS
jgi:magnesium-transporting ATPase (P-type)